MTSTESCRIVIHGCLLEHYVKMDFTGTDNLIYFIWNEGFGHYQKKSTTAFAEKKLSVKQRKRLICLANQ